MWCFIPIPKKDKKIIALNILISYNLLSSIHRKNMIISWCLCVPSNILILCHCWPYNLRAWFSVVECKTTQWVSDILYFAFCMMAILNTEHKEPYKFCMNTPILTTSCTTTMKLEVIFDKFNKIGICTLTQVIGYKIIKLQFHLAYSSPKPNKLYTLILLKTFVLISFNKHLTHRCYIIMLS